jgi:hypothetical protein
MTDLRFNTFRWIIDVARKHECSKNFTGTLESCLMYSTGVGVGIALWCKIYHISKKLKKLLKGMGKKLHILVLCKYLT